MRRRKHIIADPAILTGKPVLKGTRLAVEFLLELMAQGWTEEEILRNYPGLKREQLLAVAVAMPVRDLPKETIEQWIARDKADMVAFRATPHKAKR